MLNVAAQGSECVCVAQTPVGPDMADLMLRGSTVFYMQSLLPACVVFCVGGYMNHKSWLIPVCGFSSQDFSRRRNSSTQRHNRELVAALNHDASRSHSTDIKVLVINLWFICLHSLIKLCWKFSFWSLSKFAPRPVLLHTTRWQHASFQLVNSAPLCLPPSANCFLGCFCSRLLRLCMGCKAYSHAWSSLTLLKANRFPIVLSGCLSQTRRTSPNAFTCTSVVELQSN